MEAVTYLSKVKVHKIRPIDNMVYIAAYLAECLEKRTGIAPDKIVLGRQADTYAIGIDFYKDNKPIRASFNSLPRGHASTGELLAYMRGLRDAFDFA